jgi:predicted O-methyltransferase YrrM
LAVRREDKVHPHVPAERAHLFDAHNAGTTELEVLNWLHATILVLKPQNVLETGAADGLGTIAMASACRNNGFGTVHSVELDPKLCESLHTKLRRHGLSRFAQVHCQDSRTFLSENATIFDIGFFDSMCEFRAQEFEICLDRGTIRTLAVFHDTSPRRCESLRGWPSDDEHAAYRNRLHKLAADPRVQGFFESELSRGFICLSLKKPD